MKAIELLRELHDLEKPLLQANDWERLRVPVRQLLERVKKNASRELVLKLLEELCLDGQVMLLPDWDRWKDPEQESAGSRTEPSRRQWQPDQHAAQPPARRAKTPEAAHGQVLPTWSHREVFLPDDLEDWSLRSRVAEVLRLLSSNRERFGLESSTAHISYELQQRFRPNRAGSTLAQVVSELSKLVQGGALSRAEKPEALVSAIEVVAAAFGRYRNTSTLASFQARAWESILRTLFATEPSHRATMVTAGVSSGKTFSFLLPAVTLVVYRALLGQKGKPRVLVIYPRTSLVEDQHRVLRELLAEVNAELLQRNLGTQVSTRVALDAGQMLGDSLGDKGSLAEVLPKIQEHAVEFILTTPESLKNRMLDPRAVRRYLENAELVVLDEIHLMEGLAGTHGIYFVRRLRHTMRSLRAHTPDFEPCWVGASATVAEPVTHAARIFSLRPEQVRHETPLPNELVRFGTFHHALIHTRVGKPSISAVTNGLSCLVHNRNDSTAHSHYVDPGAEPLSLRPARDIEKTLVFVDSLSTIGRLRFTTADNENCVNPNRTTAPYYAWFYQPAFRHGAPPTEQKELGERLTRAREWCRKCHRGEPALLDTADLKHPTFATLRTGGRGLESVPGLDKMLQEQEGQIGNLDQCPYLQARLCWWFSQDAGVQRPLTRGQLPVRIDQNRAIAYTSKTEEVVRLHDDVNDYFQVEPQEVWPQPLPVFTQQTVSTLLASPRIEVGVDFKNVRDGLTHKALRSAASFQQKAGRVGREDDTNSLIVTFLAQRPTDAHFAHHPERLINPRHLDPIPLKDENPDVLKHHLFAAVLQWIASRESEIPASGSRLDIIGPDSANVPESWEDKVRACIDVLQARRDEVTNYLLEATRQNPGMAPVAGKAIDTLLGILRLFVLDLGGVYKEGGTPARWFKENRRVHPEPVFEQVANLWPEVRRSLERLLPRLSGPAQASAKELERALQPPAPSAAQVQQGANTLWQNAIQLSPHIDPALAGELFTVVAEVRKLAGLLEALRVHEPLGDLVRAHDIIKAFFVEVSDDIRRMTQYYLHDLLTGLVPFRDDYPFGLVRTHFQHINERQVRVVLGRNEEETESIGVALFELLPGSWNYRWKAAPRKSLCGQIDAHEKAIRLDTIPGAIFEQTHTFIQEEELPPDMPGLRNGPVPVYRPVRLVCRHSTQQPRARRDNQLIGDDDESPVLNDPRLVKECQTLPRSAPATWYSVNHGQELEDVVGEGSPEPGQPLPHTLPALGRALLRRVARTDKLQLDRYVYALDRTYGIEIRSPRLHYQWGDKHVVLGDSFKETDALVLTLQDSAVNAVLEKAWATPYLRAELTARALRQFIVRVTRCSPFEANMLRKLVLASFLDESGTLAILAPAACASAFSMSEGRQQQLSHRLLDGVFAGIRPSELGESRQRQEKWYEGLRPFMLTLAKHAGDFSEDFVRTTARELLLHTFAVSTREAVGRLVGAVEQDLGYFFRASQGEVFVFDMVEGGNGYSETAARFFQIPPLRRLLDSAGGAESTLPSSDGFTLLQEAMASCPSQVTTRLIFETCVRNVSKPESLEVSREPIEDLQARLRHEYDELSGSRPIIDYLHRERDDLFSRWQDLLWLELVPEWFAQEVVSANVCSNFESMISRTHLCVTGCRECVDNGDASIYGGLASREHVSGNLLELLRQHCVASEPAAYLRLAAGTRKDDAALRTQPLSDVHGAPLKVTIGGRELHVPRERVTFEPDPEQNSSLLLARGAGRWTVSIPILASFRDERPKE